MANNPTTPVVYRDIDLTFSAHPVTKDISKKNNQAAVVQSIKNLVSISTEELLFEPDIGGGINSLLFKLNHSLMAYDLRKIIEQTIKNNEPRCELISIEVFSDQTKKSIYARLEFHILNIATPFTEEILLKRYR